MKLLSVAIPCYNSAAYMSKAIDSCLVLGEDVEIIYGVVAGIAEVDNEETGFVGGTPVNAEGEVADGYRALIAKANDTDYSILEIKLCGITDDTQALNCNAYIIIDGTVKYINGDETSDKAKAVTYNGL